MTTVLVVDDEPDVLDALGDTLRSYGFDVTCAATRHEGMAQQGEAENQPTGSWSHRGI